MAIQREIPMSLNDFHRMPWRLGWKHEYSEDRAYLSPSHVVMNVALPATSWPDAPPTGRRRSKEAFTAPGPGDAFELERLFFEAFMFTAEFIGFDEEGVLRNGADSIRWYFGGKDGAPMPASRIVKGKHGMVGAMLIIASAKGPFTYLLMVHPHHQRSGLGKALLAEATATLREDGYDELHSQFYVANAPSRQWHEKMGFIEDPDLAATSHYRNFYRHELRRLREDPKSDAGELERVQRQFDRWDRLAEEKGVFRW